ncbi:BTAD domain-containing putative transcriptional regulator [Actinokineospora sp.]|uniref:BTAD domain-containing putative transcriptional regulator n=1 Tax=Actinokineospora sp. TaxID=1872133 RepID=UPI003D6C5F86
MRVEVCVLGRFAVRIDGDEVDAAAFGGRLARRLIRLLVARRGSVVSRDALVEALWPRSPPANPDANVNVLVNRARRALGDPALIRTVAGGYLLAEVASLTVDAQSFADGVEAARKRLDPDPAGALATAETALRFWGEPWAEDADADWARSPRERLDRLRQECLELAATAALRVGHHVRARELAEDAVTAAPLREPAHLLLVRSLALAGDQGAALAAYRRLRRRLSDELGIDPSAEAEHLHGRLLRREFAPGSDHELAAPRGPFVGRGRELAALRKAGRLALVAGQPGTGKSRLLSEFAAEAEGTVITARAVLPERDRPWSLAQAVLRAAVEAGLSPRKVLPARSVVALSEVLPELAEAADKVTVDAGTARALVLEGAVRLLSASGRVLLLVDDLQWADASSLELLALLATRAENVSMVLAFRTGEMTGRFLSDLRGSVRPDEIRLAALDAAAIGELAGDPMLAKVLIGETDRTPFAIVEVLRALDGLESDDLPTHAREVARSGRRRSILARAEPLAETARDLLGLLAVLGRPASAEFLAEACGIPFELVTEHLGALCAAELAGNGRRGFGTSHDLVAETVRDALAPGAKASLHRLLAMALATGAAGDGERASHLTGAGDHAAAAVAYAATARRRLERFADGEAHQLAEAGLALDPADAVRAELLEVRAQALARTGKLAEAREDLRVALTHATSPPTRASLLTELAVMSSGSDDLVRAANLIELALTEAADDPVARARALTAGGTIDINLDRRGRAAQRYDEALSLFERAGDARGVADILDARAMAVFLDGDIDTAVAAYEQAAQLFLDSGNLLRVVTPRSSRGHALVFAGQPESALVDATAAAELANSLGFVEGEGAAHWIMSEALSGMGLAAEAIAAAEKAESLAAETGHRGWAATAARGLGIAREAAGDLAAAESAFRRSLELSTRIPLFACWAHSRLALVLVAGGGLDEAAEHVDSALVTGPPLGHYEARLAGCALAVAKGDPAAEALLADAIELAVGGGHRASLTRLRALRHGSAV